ncbi:MAG: hypothetical protein QM756_10480 [Polyangiaceae bacterium]
MSFAIVLGMSQRAARIIKNQSPVRAPAVVERLEQARRRRAKGEGRRAMILMREACCMAPEDAVLWTLYAVQCWRMNRRDDARTALRQALWLREQSGDTRRAHVLRALLLGMESACAQQAVHAA